MLRTRHTAVVFSIAACLVATLVCKNADAEHLAPLDQTFHLDVGIFVLDTNTTIRVDGVNGATGSTIDLHHDFGFDKQDRFRMDGYWRFFDRHKLRFMYFDSTKSEERHIAEEIHFGDTIFPINASVRAEVQTQIIELVYEYSFMRRDSFELAGSFGLHNIKFSTQLTAAASSNLGSGGIDRNSSAEGNGPLPVIGLRFIWALSDQFYFNGLIQYFGVKIDEYDGGLSDYKFDFVWQPWKHFGMGLGYNQFTSRLDVNAPRFDGQLRFKYGGPQIFLTTAF